MNTQPIAVTIYPDRARVTRSGKTTIAPGFHQLSISDLPLALIPESVRASGKGTAQAKLLGVSTHLENYVETPAESVLELETKVQELADADANLAARAAILEKEQKALDGIASQSEQFARGLALRNRTPEEQGKILDFITRRGQAIQTELLALSRSRREKAKELDRLKRVLQNHHSARPRQRYTATLELDVQAEGTLTIDLTYVVRNAAWKPLYDLRMTDSTLDVTYLAQIKQNTGEDWPGVQLTLSTAEPSLSLDIPELEPWYIAPRVHLPAMVRQRSLPMPMAAPAPQASSRFDAERAPVAEAAPEPAEQELVMEEASISAAGASFTYKLSANADVPGNNDPRKVSIASFPLKPELDYVTAPKLEEVCYRRALVKNTSAYTLLPGPAQLFEGDDYLGSTYLEFVAPNQEFELVLGADDRLRIDRELLQREVEKAFMVGDRRRIRYGYNISLENLRDKAQVIFIRDQIPVPRDEQIKVKLESADPKPSEHTHLNLLEWKITAAAGAKPSIRYEFTIEFPRSMSIDGLP